MITLAISTYNRHSYLEKFIQSLKILSPSPGEIIIVNDGSTDGTREYLERLESEGLPFRVIHHDTNNGLSAGRNTAIQNARGEIIVFTDDDCTVTPDWIGEIIKPFVDSHIVSAYGQVIYNAPDYRGYFPERLVQNIGPKWPMGANIAYRVSALRKVGLFDTALFRYHNEDSEMAFRLARVGVLTSVKTAIVYHQEMDWTCKSLLSSARNASVWPILYKKYGREIYNQKFRPPISAHHIVNATDYVYFVTSPLLIPILLTRYLAHGKRDLRLFFCKWPIYFIIRRLLIWHEALRNKVFMI